MNQTKLREKAANVSLDLGLMGAGAEMIYDALLCVLLEERERCAKFAESPVCGCKTEDIHDGCCASCGRRIAKAIRKTDR